MILDFLKTSFTLIICISLVVAVGVTIVRSIEYIENNIYGVKDTIMKILFTVIALHLYFLFLGMPFWHLIFSLSIQAVFYSLFDVYPMVKPEDPKFLYGVFASLINHFLLVRLFMNRETGIIHIMLCFIIIWTTPFCFFFTMSATDDVPFIPASGRTTKTLAGKLIEWMMNFKRNKTEQRE